MVASSEQLISSRSIIESDLDDEFIKDIPISDILIKHRIQTPDYDSGSQISSDEDLESRSLSQESAPTSEICYSSSDSSTSTCTGEGTTTSPSRRGGVENVEESIESSQVIQEVWAHNLLQEFRNICGLITDFPFVAMDTEFPGVVAKPLGDFNNMEEYRYQQVKCNVDLLKLIQLGISLFDREGNSPKGISTWQFNFKFNLSEDLYAEDSINLLENSGIDFGHHSTIGIDPSDFAELLLSSGLVLMDNVTWLTFHSAYDFAYLLAQLTAVKIPETEADFLDTLKLYFPHIYDIKYLMRATESPCGGLQKVADRLKVKRVGCQHQAGSDSLLTGQVFFAMYSKYFKVTGLDDVKFSGQICGLGSTGNLEGTEAFSVKDDFEESVLCLEFGQLNSSQVCGSPLRDH